MCWLWVLTYRFIILKHNRRSMDIINEIPLINAQNFLKQIILELFLYQNFQEARFNLKIRFVDPITNKENVENKKLFFKIKLENRLNLKKGLLSNYKIFHGRTI